ncbi:hypothetical protein J7T55_000761 [Diaporthe amygdali]|uniref:uncharacterized protein n=1 Tax=Phomopsis amygdali TaxID=1214568 RepID=UPI0022FE27EA|nr:uncharacterized protein J7T55_000761 [Diaporthe amygdali]KAJ0119911.1 hypothetical protein J7T55_000761 [Diaporthe amygdali]
MVKQDGRVRKCYSHNRLDAFAFVGTIVPRPCRRAIGPVVPLIMPTNKRRESISRVVRPITGVRHLFRIPPRRVQSTPLTPDPTSSKRKASTSAPSSPTTTRCPSKRPDLELPERHTPIRVAKPGPAVLSEVPSPSAPPSPPSSVSEDTRAALDPKTDYDSEELSCLISCEASHSRTGSLAPDQSSARASARAVDKRDANNVLKLIKEVRRGEYKVEKGGPRGKYLGLEEENSEEENSEEESSEEEICEEERSGGKGSKKKAQKIETLDDYVKHRVREQVQIAKERLVEAEKELADFEKKMVETKAKVDREAAPEVENGAPEKRSGQTTEKVLGQRAFPNCANGSIKERGGNTTLDAQLDAQLASSYTMVKIDTETKPFPLVNAQKQKVPTTVPPPASAMVPTPVPTQQPAPNSPPAQNPFIGR